MNELLVTGLKRILDTTENLRLELIEYVWEDINLADFEQDRYLDSLLLTYRCMMYCEKIYLCLHNMIRYFKVQNVYYRNFSFEYSHYLSLTLTMLTPPRTARISGLKS